jgi:glycosyltransferase involved in cell wall biosynthesis
MKIFYINVIEQNSGWGAECFVNRGFNKNNVKIINLDYRKYRNNLVKKFSNITEDFSVLLLQRGDGFPIDLIKTINRPRFFWASELVSRNWDQNRLLKSGLFNHIFVRSNTCKQIIEKRGWLESKRISILTSGFDEEIHRPLPNVISDLDIVFVGSITKRRRKYLDILKQKFTINESYVFGEEMVKIFNRAKIVINIHAEKYLDTETRIFEALGCNSFVITEKLSAENPFKPGYHLIEVTNIDEMTKKISYYLEHKIEREKIAKCGHSYALANHTYTIRAKQITKIMELYTKSNNYNLPAITLKKNNLFFIKDRIFRTIYCFQKLSWIFCHKLKNIFL